MNLTVVLSSLPPTDLLVPVTELHISSAITKTPARQDKKTVSLWVSTFHYFASFLLLLLLQLTEQPVEYVYSLLLFTKKKYQAANKIPVYSQTVLSTRNPGNRESWGAVGAAIEETVEAS